MKEKKSDRGNLENKRALFVLIGLAIALVMVYASFELFAKEDSSSSIVSNNEEFIQVKDQDVLATDKPKDIPAKPSIPQATIIHEVSNSTKVIDVSIFISEFSPNEAVPDISNLQPIDIVPEATDPEPPKKFSDEMPKFPGGMDALTDYLTKEIHYPELARTNGIQGTVLIEFVVEKDGRVSNPKVLVPLFPDCDKEAMRGILAMPKWEPGKNMGKPVRCYFDVPVKFQL